MTTAVWQGQKVRSDAHPASTPANASPETQETRFPDSYALIAGEEVLESEPENVGTLPTAVVYDQSGLDFDAACLSAARIILAELRLNSINSPSGCQLNHILSSRHMELPKEQLLGSLEKLAGEYGLVNIFMENHYTIGATKAW